MDSGRVIRFCLLGLPAGLLVIGVISMVFTQLTGGPETEETKAEIKKSQVAGIMRKKVNRPDLERYVRTLAEDIGERNVEKYEELKTAAFWIESTLGPSNMGYEVSKQRYTAAGKDVWNLIAELPGNSRADEIVVVGAHYDTVPGSPGANDNGTGIAALLSLANAFSGTENARTLRFVAFVNEEPPFFQTEEMGSLVYARSLKNAGAKVVAMITPETIGCYSDKKGSQSYPPELEGQFPPTGDFIALVGNHESRELIEAARAAYEQSGARVPIFSAAFPKEIPGVGWSDHWAFWQVGYPALMMTDTAPYRYEHYHRPTDTPDRIDFERYAEVVKGMKAILEAWANP